MKRIFLTFWITLLLSAALISCAGQTQEAPTSSDAARPAAPAEYAGKTNPLDGKADAIEAGKKTYQIYCAACHGETGLADGPSSASLNPKPRPLAKTQAALDDAYLYWRTAEGGLMAPFKSAMPSWKNSLSEEQIWQIIAFIRTLR